jgi:hypothetical protein
LKKALLPFLLLIPLVLSCSQGKPPDELFHKEVDKMVLLDRAMEFKEEITRISVVGRTVYEDQVEVEVRLEGWAIHRDLAIGAALPASKVKRPGWAIWKFFCRKVDKTWVIVEKYKVEEGFDEK